MKTRNRGWVGVLLATLFAGCASTGSSPDGSTSWLRACDARIACGSDLECICGVCTRTCGGNESCSALGPNAACANATILADVCGGLPASGGVCFSSCRDTSDCSSFARCMDGVCVSVAARPGVDASAGNAGDGGASSSGGNAGQSSSGGGAGTQTQRDGSAPCTTNQDCPKDYVCGFLESEGCAASGECFRNTGDLCNGIFPACACDGTVFNYDCVGEPPGYGSKPFAHRGACSVSDASTDVGTCTTNLDCPANQLCGFSQKDGCSATGQCFPIPIGGCNSLPIRGCACDGTDVLIGCGNGYPPGYDPKPVASPHACSG